MAVLVENVVELPQLIEEHKDELAVPDRDSGHWSECTLPYHDLDDQELAEETNYSCETPTRTYSSRGTPAGSSPTPERLTLDVWDSIPLPPTPPPILASAQLASISHSVVSSVIGITCTDETNVCIICYDPNKTTTHEVWDDFYWDMQIEHHSTHKTLPCCGRLVCPSCLAAIKSTNINEGRVQIFCPHPECGKPFSKAYILQDLDTKTKEKYQRFIVDIANDGKRKTCPNCGMITEHQMPAKLRRTKKSDIAIKCETCDLEWCFKCQAPWHEGVSCRTYQKGDKHFQKWTKSRSNNVANCQKCPTCRVFIQRSAGCNHMTCNRCYTEFCYRCGDRFLILDHDSTLNAWGCSENLYPNRPFLRKTVRGGYLSAKLSYLIAYPPLLVGVGAIVVIGGAIILPIYGGFKLYNLIKYKRELNANKRRHTNMTH